MVSTSIGLKMLYSSGEERREVEGRGGGGGGRGASCDDGKKGVKNSYYAPKITFFH